MLQERLSIILRYLATGNLLVSLSYLYLAGLTTVSNIIGETTEIIWDCLHKEVIPPMLTKHDWLRISNHFENKWNFNHCIGPIDGKHVFIQCPNNAGSSYFNYKNTHSIILLGICDANYNFTFVDIGAFGRRSDGEVFRDSKIGEKFHLKRMNLPDAKPSVANSAILIILRFIVMSVMPESSF
ncbi:uncharacterized protein [Prorops nasuta]|uniref:uncharacterized protein n=1 Tax=Prorops nasuta TaxID=863751 RepID=UPI0034CFA79B